MAADDRLSPDDARILALESDAIVGHTLKMIRLEPADSQLDLDRLRASVDARLEPGSRGRERVELSRTRIGCPPRTSTSPSTCAAARAPMGSTSVVPGRSPGG